MFTFSIKLEKWSFHVTDLSRTGKKCTEIIKDSVSIDNEYNYENEILPLTIIRMRFAQNTCSTRSVNSFHDEISSKTRSARNEFLKAKVYLL